MRIYLGQLQRGAFVIRRRSAAWNVTPALLHPTPICSVIHPSPCSFMRCFAALVSWVWRVASCHIIICTTTTSYSLLWPRISQWTLSVLHNPSAGAMVISTAACHCVISSSKETDFYLVLSTSMFSTPRSLGYISHYVIFLEPPPVEAVFKPFKPSHWCVLLNILSYVSLIQGVLPFPFCTVIRNGDRMRQSSLFPLV